MSQTTGEFLVSRLHDWGVRTIFGYSGDGINGVLRGFVKQGSQFDFVQARHEEMAAFMACGFAKFSGQLGVCLSTGGPGASHMLTGLYDAKLDHQPVLAVTGQAARSVRGASYQQELNLDRMFADVAEYVQEGTTPGQVGVILDRAIRTALGRRAPRPSWSCPTTFPTRPTRRPSGRTAMCAQAWATPARACSPTRPTCAARPRC